jgi:ferredoxin-NADP reductase
MAAERLETLVAEIRDEAPGIRSYELKRADGGEMPPFAAGAHVDVDVPGGPVRQYSLCNPPSERHRYVIAVKREEAGRGGSAAFVDKVRQGDRLRISPPRNHFPLSVGAKRHVLIAGGIGIAPMLAMAHELRAQGADFTLYYCTRSPELTAFRDLLARPPFGGHVRFHHDGGDPARGIDLKPIVAAPGPGTHLYCCGPRGLMDAVRGATRHWPAGNVHFEDFSPAAPKANDRPFQIKIASSGRIIDVPADKTVLAVLRESGYEVPSSCEAGSCGTCMTGLVAGDVDHRDFVLDDNERKHFLMVCVSRAKSGMLTLDL